MSRCRINKLRFERKEEARSVFTSRGSRLCLPTALWQTGLGRNVPSASPHPPTHTAGRAASRGNAPGRTWKDLEGRYASGRAAHTAPRPGWLAAPLILVRFLPTRGLRQWPSSFWAGSGWLPVWRLSLGLGLGFSAQGDSTAGHVAGTREHTWATAPGMEREQVSYLRASQVPEGRRLLSSWRRDELWPALSCFRQ